MKNIFLFIVFSSVFAACTKTTNPKGPISPQYILKKIINPKDSVYIPESNVPTITQKIDSFNYDVNNRLISKYKLVYKSSNGATLLDSTNEYIYYYASSNSNQITGYSVRQLAYDSLSGTNVLVLVNHTLLFDVNNRLVLDSISNPLIGGGDKVSRIIYLPNAIVKINAQTFVIGKDVSIDTLYFNGDNVSAVNSVDTNYNSVSPAWFSNVDFTFSTFINPYSYINNFSGGQSDKINRTNLGLMSVYALGSISANLYANAIVTYWSKTIPRTSYPNNILSIVDTLNRVVQTIGINNNFKSTYYQYY